MTSNPPRDDNAQPEQAPALSLGELAKAALQAQKQSAANYQHRKNHDLAVRRPPAPRGSRRSMGKR